MLELNSANDILDTISTCVKRIILEESDNTKNN